jgi:hypothetical protein
MRLKAIKLKDWWWVGYPVLVAGFMVCSINLMVNNSQMISDFSGKQKQAQEAQAQVERLKDKLKSLEEIDRPKETERLTKILTAMPTSRKVWILVSEVNQTASMAGAIVKEYRGVVGEMKEASESAVTETSPEAESAMSLKVQYDYGPFEMMYRVLAELERQQPLVKVSKVSFKETGSEVVLEGAWGPWSRLTKDVESPLPSYEEAAIKAEANLDKLERAAGI